MERTCIKMSLERLPRITMEYKRRDLVRRIKCCKDEQIQVFASVRGISTQTLERRRQGRPT